MGGRQEYVMLCPCNLLVINWMHLCIHYIFPPMSRIPQRVLPRTGLCPPDDEGRSSGGQGLVLPRARQSILEEFMANLGRCQYFVILK